MKCFLVLAIILTAYSYVNASYESDDPIGELMHDFLCSDPDEMKTGILADRYLKTDPKEVETMCAEIKKCGMMQKSVQCRQMAFQ